MTKSIPRLAVKGLNGWHVQSTYGAKVSAEVKNLASSLTVDAAGILLGLPYQSYCSGSNQLVSLGVWDNDGQLTDTGFMVRNTCSCGLRWKHDDIQRIQGLQIRHDPRP